MMATIYERKKVLCFFVDVSKKWMEEEVFQVQSFQNVEDEGFSIS